MASFPIVATPPVRGAVAFLFAMVEAPFTTFGAKWREARTLLPGLLGQ